MQPDLKPPMLEMIFFCCVGWIFFPIPEVTHVLAEIKPGPSRELLYEGLTKYKQVCQQDTNLSYEITVTTVQHRRPLFQ